MKTSIIMPTFWRPEQVRRNTIRLLETVEGLDTETIVVIEQDGRALDTLADLPVITTYHEDWQGSMANWNIGAVMATGDVLVLGADDIWFHDNWLHNALAHMEATRKCFVGLNDLMWNGTQVESVPHWAITRQGIIDHCGGCLMPPMYKTTWGDNEINARIRRAGQWSWCNSAIVEHLHHGNDKAKMDRSYRMCTRNFHDDKAVFEARKAAGFPDDFEPVVFAL